MTFFYIQKLRFLLSEPKYSLKTKLYIQKHAFEKIF